jgi:hypothetical protein
MRVNMSNFSKFLRNTLKAQDSNIQPYQLDNSKVWLKKASERHSAWIYMPLKWVARILNIELQFLTMVEVSQFIVKFIVSLNYSH